MTLPCILCGEADAAITVDMATGSEFHCGNCEGDFNRLDVKAVVRQWSRALEWLATMPMDGPEGQ